jgi:hypothetical protein
MNILEHRPLSRRDVLKGLGATIALPFLEAMLPAPVRAAAAVRRAAASVRAYPTRLAAVYLPNGVTLADWKPATTGTNYQFSRILKPLAPYRNELLVVSGLADRHGEANGDGPGDHARAMASYFTAAQPYKTAGANIRAGVSLDQVMARRIGAATPFPSLELGLEYGHQAGNCDSGYACTYENNLAWSSPTTPCQKAVNPQLVFDRLFGGRKDGDVSEAAGQEAVFRQSILDFVQEDTARLSRRLGAADRDRMDQYLTAIRDVELRLQRPPPHLSAEITGRLQRPAGVPELWSDHFRLMADLQTLAFQGDLTRICTLITGVEGSRRVFTEIGIQDEHHGISHHKNDPAKIEQITRINVLQMENLAYFIGKLQATPEGDGTLLDHMMVLASGGLSDGNTHRHYDLPTLLFGRANGNLLPGRHIAYDAKAKVPIANLYLNMLHAMGIEADQFGDSTNRLTDLATAG